MVNKKIYNRFSIPYQILTNRFISQRNYSSSGFYKCFGKENHIAKEEYLEPLRIFEGVKLKEVYIPKHIEEISFSESFLDAELIKITETKACFHKEFEHVLFYFIISMVKNEIEEYLKLLLNLQKNNQNAIKITEEGDFIAQSFFWDSLTPKFRSIENYDIIFHFLARSNTAFFSRDSFGKIEIKLGRIKKILETVQCFDFSKINYR